MPTETLKKLDPYRSMTLETNPYLNGQHAYQKYVTVDGRRMLNPYRM